MVRNTIVLLVAGMLIAPGVAYASPQAKSKSSPQFVPWKAEEALLVSGSKAVYNQFAAITHTKGCVYVRAIVAEDGSTTNVVFLTGPSFLMGSVLDAVMSWRFTPSKQEIVTVVPVCFFASGDDPQKLVSSYRKAAEKHPDAKNLTALAYELLLMGLPDDAAKQFRQALSLKADSADALLGLADCLATAGDLVGAVDGYQQGLAAAPKNELARVKLADWLRHEGDLDGAIAQYRIILKNNSGNDLNDLYRSTLAGLLLETGNADEAIEQYKQALRHAAFDYPPAHYGLGQAYEKKGDTANALKEYKEAMREMPLNTQFRDAYNRLSSH